MSDSLVQYYDTQTKIANSKKQLADVTEQVKPITETLWESMQTRFLNLRNFARPFLFVAIMAFMAAGFFGYPVSRLVLVLIVTYIALEVINLASISLNVPAHAPEVIREHFGIDQTTPIYIDEYNCVCQAPSNENPFMNVLPYDNPYRPKACNANNSEIDKRIVKFFYNNPAFINRRDIFQRHNDMHQWFTQPGSTIPPDREAWMQDAYRGMSSCKSNQKACIQHLWDLRRP